MDTSIRYILAMSLLVFSLVGWMAFNAGAGGAAANSGTAGAANGAYAPAAAYGSAPAAAQTGGNQNGANLQGSAPPYRDAAAAAPAAAGGSCGAGGGGCGCGGGRAPAAPSGPAPAPAAIVAGVQKVSVHTNPNGYDNPRITVRVGTPVEFTFSADPNSGCGRQLILDGFGVSLVSRNGEQQVATFTPTTAGQFEYHCGMRMYRGTLYVV